MDTVTVIPGSAGSPVASKTYGEVAEPLVAGVVQADVVAGQRVRLVQSG